MRIKIICFVILLWSSLGANAADFDLDAKPVPAPEKWTSLYGEYLLDDEKIIIREDRGSLHVIFNPTYDGSRPDNLKDWALSETASGKFTYNLNGVLVNLVFQFNQNGQGSAIIIGDDIYSRNYIEPKDGSSFKVTLDKAIEDYIKVALEAKPPTQQGDLRAADLVDVTMVLDNVRLDIRYATTNNFLNVPTYSQAKSFLQRPALMALNEANKKLNALGFGILIHDTYRPWYVTKVFWDTTEGFERDFVANPSSGSKHNMGSAVDMTLYDLQSGEVIKMVGTYDEMSDRSYPDYMGGTSLERWHRDLMRTYVEAEGFTVVSNEWWHYDHEDWQQYPILNQTFEELLDEN